MKAMIELAFERMQTPEERQLAEFVEKNKGADRGPENATLNATLMKKIVDMENQKATPKDGKGPTGKGPTGKGSTGKALAQTALTVPELEKEIRKDVDTVLAENTEEFERMFATIESSLKELDVTIKRQSDRVISEILAGIHAGPHERIKDRVSSLDF